MKFLIATSVLYLFIFKSICEYGYARKQTMSLIFIQTHTDFKPEYLSRYDLTILPKAPGRELTMDLVVIRNFTLNPMMRLVILMQTRRNGNFRSILAFDLDFCNFMFSEERVKHIIDANVGRVLDVWTNIIKKYGNMPKCPVVEGSYSIRNLRPDKKSIPSFFITGKYRITVSSYFKDTEPRYFFSNASLDVELRRN